MPRNGQPQAGQFIGLEFVIGIEKRQPGAPGIVDAGIASRVGIGGYASQEPMWRQTQDREIFLWKAASRSVADDDQLEVPLRLPPGTGRRARQIIRVGVPGNDDAEQRATFQWY